MLHVRQVFERVGRSSPVLDPALTQAARTLAREALLSSAEAASGTRIGLAVSEAGGWDPNPRLVLIRSWPTQTTLGAFLQRTDFAGEAASHAGIALVADEDHTVLALLLADRKAQVQAFPRKVEKAPARPRLCFELRAPLGRPSVYVTRPSGVVDRLTEISGRTGAAWCAPVPLQGNGRHALEVIGEGAEGPEVAAMFSVEVGPAAPATPVVLMPQGPEPATPGEARARLLARVNDLRGAAGLPAVAPDPKLDAVAQAYADRMATQRFFAHVAPDGEALPDRLEQAGYAYQASGENLGMASGPLAAHAAIEESPGHRKNLLDPAFERIGFGLARQPRDGGSETLLVELLATPAKAGVDPVAGAYARLGAERAALKLPALQRSAALEDIATRQARAALARDDPRAPDIDSQVFGVLSEARTASADLYVARDLSALPPSRGLREPRYSLVGIGAVRGDSPTYGKGRYWVVVIYAGE